MPVWQRTRRDKLLNRATRETLRGLGVIRHSPENGVQDTAVSIVIHFDRCIDATVHGKVDGITIELFALSPGFLSGLKIIIDVNGERLGSIKP